MLKIQRLLQNTLQTTHISNIFTILKSLLWIVFLVDKKIARISGYFIFIELRIASTHEDAQSLHPSRLHLVAHSTQSPRNNY